MGDIQPILKGLGEHFAFEHVELGKVIDKFSLSFNLVLPVYVRASSQFQCTKAEIKANESPIINYGSRIGQGIALGPRSFGFQAVK